MILKYGYSSVKENRVLISHSTLSLNLQIIFKHYLHSKNKAEKLSAYTNNVLFGLYVNNNKHGQDIF